MELMTETHLQHMVAKLQYSSKTDKRLTFISTLFFIKLYDYVSLMKFVLHIMFCLAPPDMAHCSGGDNTRDTSLEL